MSTDHAPHERVTPRTRAHRPPPSAPRGGSERARDASALPVSSQNAEGERRLLTVREAALRLGVSRATIYRLLGAGALPSLTIGRARRISAQALSTFITHQEQAGT